MRMKDITEVIGQTPLVKLNHQCGADMAEVYVKLEFQNPGGSVKDRIALRMIQSLEKEGKITSHTRLVEPTSGNTGIGLAMIAAARGYSLTLVMPDTMTVERRKILQALGAELILTEGKKGMKGAMAQVDEILTADPQSVTLGQFENSANPAVHYDTTGPEIWHDTDGQIDAFVAGVGTGGTITGVGKYLKEKNPGIKVIAVEPTESPVLSGGQPGSHTIQGIGAGFIPPLLEVDLMDEIIQVSGEEAMLTTRRIAREEGLLLGYSSGAAIFAALQTAEKLGAGKRVVVISASNGERYLSTNLFEANE